MGSGASKKQSSGQESTSIAERSSSNRKSTKRGAPQPASSEFEDACLHVFQQADHDNNGTLDVNEFWSVLNSKSLNLKLSQTEMNSILEAADVDKDGVITYNEFVPVVKQLLAMVYRVC